MFVRELIEDAVRLYYAERYHSAFCLSLVAVEAAAFLRYGSTLRSSAQRFKRFINDETKTDKIKIKHGVDVPPEPVRPPPPEFAYTSNESIRKGLAETKRWCEQVKKVHESDNDRFLDAGDNFDGRYKTPPSGGKRKWVSYLGKPRLVSTTGILWKARCEIIHTGRLDAIKIVRSDPDSFMVGGADPTEFSSTWIAHVLGIVIGSAEVSRLLEPS